MYPPRIPSITDGGESLGFHDPLRNSVLEFRTPVFKTDHVLIDYQPYRFLSGSDTGWTVQPYQAPLLKKHSRGEDMKTNFAPMKPNLEGSNYELRVEVPSLVEVQL